MATYRVEGHQVTGGGRLVTRRAANGAPYKQLHLIFPLQRKVCEYVRHATVSQERDPNRFNNLRNAWGEWADSYGEIVAKMKSNRLDLKRQKILAEARAKQEAKGAAYTEQRQHERRSWRLAYTSRYEQT